MLPKEIEEKILQRLGDPLPSEEVLRSWGIRNIDDIGLPPNATYADLVIHNYVVLPARGNLSALRDLFNRLLGKPMQRVEQTNVHITYDQFLQQCDKNDVIDADSVVVVQEDNEMPTNVIEARSKKKDQDNDALDDCFAELGL